MDIRYVLTCCTDMALGDYRKYPWPYMHTDGFSQFWGQGGFWFELEIQEHWGVLTTGIPKAWGGGGGLDLEFPQGKDDHVFLENAYFIDLISLQTKHKLTTLLMAAEDKHPLISDVFIWYSFVVTKTRNDLQWPTMTYNDLQWPTMSYYDRTCNPCNELKWRF